MKGRSQQLLCAGAIIMALASPAIAADCQADLDAIDQNVTTTAPISPAEMQQVLRLRNLGQAECEAGNITQGLAYLAEAKAILGL